MGSRFQPAILRHHSRCRVGTLNQPALIYVIIFFVFCAVILAVQGGYWFFTEVQRRRGAINRRLVLTKNSFSTQEVLETLRRERGLAGLDNKYLAQLNELIMQTGLRVDGKWLIAIGCSLGLLFFVLFGLAIGYGLTSFILSALLGALSLVVFFALMRRKRVAKFSEQLPDAIDVIVRGVKAGYPFIISLGLVAKEMTDPIGTEFGMTSDEINFGSDMGTALDNLFYRVGHEDLLYLTMALKIQNETGGNLAEVLSRLARLLRQREMLRLKARAISAEGRLSAVVLTIMPFLLFGLISLIRPDFYFGVSGNPIIMPAVIVGLTMLVLGNVIIYRMVNFKV